MMSSVIIGDYLGARFIVRHIKVEATNRRTRCGLGSSTDKLLKAMDMTTDPEFKLVERGAEKKLISCNGLHRRNFSLQQRRRRTRKIGMKYLR